MGFETEMKFTVPDCSIFENVATLKTIAGFDVVDLGIRPQTDICFDTPDRRFFREKIVFRLRKRVNGSMITFKAQIPNEDSPADNLYRRIDIENPTTATEEDITQGRLPDIPAVRALVEHVGQVTIEPSLTVANNRHMMLILKDGEPGFELVLDDVTFSGPGGEHGVLELEIEAMTDDVEDLRKIGDWLSKLYDLKPAGPSKYILGMELVGGINDQLTINN